MKNLSLAGLTFITVATFAESAFAACINNDTDYEVYASFTLGGKATTARIPPGSKVCGDNDEGQVGVAISERVPSHMAIVKVHKDGSVKVTDQFLIAVDKTGKETMRNKLARPEPH